MTQKLNEGLGVCQATHEVVLRAPMSVVMLGGAKSFIQSFLMSVHHYNRHADKSDFVAINFPQYVSSEKGLMKFGKEIQLVGSESALTAVLEDARVKPLVEEFGLDDIYPREDVPTVGQAVFRDRLKEKHTKGHMERALRRAEKRNADTSGLRMGLKNLEEGICYPSKKRSSDLFIQMNKHVLSIAVEKVQATGRVEVSTYGLSSRENPLVCENTL